MRGIRIIYLIFKILIKKLFQFFSTSYAPKAHLSFFGMTPNIVYTCELDSFPPPVTYTDASKLAGECFEECQQHTHKTPIPYRFLYPPPSVQAGTGKTVSPSRRRWCVQSVISRFACGLRVFLVLHSAPETVVSVSGSPVP